MEREGGREGERWEGQVVCGWGRWCVGGVGEQRWRTKGGGGGLSVALYRARGER